MAWNVANFVSLAVIFAVLSVISLVLRFWAHRARHSTKSQFGIDDALIIPATLCVVGIAVTMIVGATRGRMAQHEKFEIGPQGPIFNDSLATYEKCNFALQLLPLVSLGLSKTSVLFFYRRIFAIHPRFKVLNMGLIVLVVAWAVAFFWGTVFQCQNPAILWSTFEYLRTNCVKTISFYYAVSITGFLTDLLILVSPIPMIWKLQIPGKSRAAVAGILLLGALVVGAGVARFVEFIRIGRGIVANINDITYFTTPVFAWTMIEASLAVVSANLPLLRPLLIRRRYPDSYAWSSIGTRPSSGHAHRQSLRRSRHESISKPSWPQEVHLESKDGSSDYQVWMEGTKMEPMSHVDRHIHVQREFEVV